MHHTLRMFDKKTFVVMVNMTVYILQLYSLAMAKSSHIAKYASNTCSI